MARWVWAWRSPAVLPAGQLERCCLGPGALGCATSKFSQSRTTQPRPGIMIVAQVRKRLANAGPYFLDEFGAADVIFYAGTDRYDLYYYQRLLVREENPRFADWLRWKPALPIAALKAIFTHVTICRLQMGRLLLWKRRTSDALLNKRVDIRPWAGLPDVMYPEPKPPRWSTSPAMCTTATSFESILLMTSYSTGFALCFNWWWLAKFVRRRLVLMRRYLRRSVNVPGISTQPSDWGKRWKRLLMGDSQVLRFCWSIGERSRSNWLCVGFWAYRNQTEWALLLLYFISLLSLLHVVVGPMVVLKAA